MVVEVDRPFEECCSYDAAFLPVDRTQLAHPKLIGIGVHKAGTTYLFNLLALSKHFVAPSTGKELFQLAQWPLQPTAWAQYL